MGWLGLQAEPAPFPPYPERTGPLETDPVPAALPAPVARYVAVALGDRIPTITTAVIIGRGRLRLSGVRFPARMRFTHIAGQSYRHDIECTWFGQPLLRVHETYIDGHARMELPFGVVANEPKVDMAANANLWGEAVWFPSVYLTDPRVRWEPVDTATAHLIVPAPESEERITVRFDAETGLIRWMEMRRYKQATDTTMTPERFEALEWQTFHGMRIPSRGALTWMDEGTPWLVMTVEDVAYNVDVSESIRTSAR
jgi:hypothetical protein